MTTKTVFYNIHKGLSVVIITFSANYRLTTDYYRLQE